MLNKRSDKVNLKIVSFCQLFLKMLVKLLTSKPLHHFVQANSMHWSKAGRTGPEAWQQTSACGNGL
jgi:carbonic anhydrase